MGEEQTRLGKWRTDADEFGEKLWTEEKKSTTEKRT
jgi:hypothetical protein